MDFFVILDLGWEVAQVVLNNTTQDPKKIQQAVRDDIMINKNVQDKIEIKHIWKSQDKKLDMRN